MKVLIVSVDKFLCNIAMLLPIETVICNRKQVKKVFRLEKPTRILISGPWGEIAGAGPNKKSVESINFCQEIKNLAGEKVEVFRCGYEDIDGKDFIRIPFSSNELLEKLGYYGRRK